jgi:hypothetical protein
MTTPSQLMLLLLMLLQSWIIPVVSRFLVVIPGFGGNEKRQSIVKASLHMYPSSHWDCMIFTFKKVAHDIPCQEVSSLGNMFAAHMKQVTPALIARKKYELIVMHMDDVAFSSGSPQIPWGQLHHFMVRNHIDVVSPKIVSGSPHAVMNPTTVPAILGTASRKNGTSIKFMGWKPTFIEIMTIIFLPQAWACFWDMIDEKTNSHGWGYDFSFPSICNVSLALLSDYSIEHLQAGGVTVDNEQSRLQMEAWLHQRNP